MNAPSPLSPAQIERLRRDAKRKARASGTPLHAALDEAAIAAGFSNWSRLMNAAADPDGDVAGDDAMARRIAAATPEAIAATVAESKAALDRLNARAPDALLEMEASIDRALAAQTRPHTRKTDTALAFFADIGALGARQEAICRELLRASHGQERGRVGIDVLFRALPLDQHLRHESFPAEDQRQAVTTTLRWLAEKPRKRPHGGQMHITYMLLPEFSVGPAEVRFSFSPLFLQELEALARHHQVPAY